MEKVNKKAEKRNLVADRVKSAGAIPKANQFIDLAATLEQEFIFEMKSTTADTKRYKINK